MLRWLINGCGFGLMFYQLVDAVIRSDPLLVPVSCFVIVTVAIVGIAVSDARLAADERIRNIVRDPPRGP